MKIAKKRFFCLIAFLLVAVLLVPPLSAFGSEPGRYTLSYGMTVYVDGISGSTDIEVSFEPEWFTHASAYTYNHELCRTACVLSAVASSTYYTSIDAGRLGFTDFSFSPEHEYSNYNEDGIACTFARRSCGKTTLILVSCASTMNEEWIGNFKIDESSVHKSFESAANSVLTRLDTYISDLKSANKCTNDISFLVLGHSRGAAVANLVAARLDASNITPPTNIYAYTFAAPNITTSYEVSDEKYMNIFNIVNPEDFVTYAPIPQWGYCKYGRVFSLPCINNKNGRTEFKRKDELLEKYDELTLGAQYRYYDTGFAETSDLISAVNYTSGGSIDGFLHTSYDLSSTLPLSIADQYNLHTKMTAAGFFKLIGQLLAGQLDYAEALPTLALAAIHPAFCHIVKYFATGAFSSAEVKELLADFYTQYPEIESYVTLDELSPLIDSLMNGRIFSAHRVETYLTWLEVIDETELTEQTQDTKLGTGGAIRITSADGSAIGKIATVIVPMNESYLVYPLNLGYATAFEPGEIESIKWSSSNLFLPVVNGKVSNLVNCYMRTTITVKLTDTDGNVYKDSITVVFYHYNRQLMRLVPNSYVSSTIQLFNDEQKQMIGSLLKEKISNWIATKIGSMFAGIFQT